MASTTRGCWSPGYARPTCRRCAANASCSRRFLLGCPAFFLPAGHSSVVACSAAVARHSTANTYSSPLSSRVGASGRCPLTPNVVASVGTSGTRASSWLSRTSSPARAFFQARQLLPGLLLPGRVAAQVAVGGPVGADAELAAQPLHRRAAGADAVGAVQVLGQLLVGPVGPVQPLPGRPLDDPAAEFGAQLRRDLGPGAGGLARGEAVGAALEVGVEPALHGAGAHPQVVGDGLPRQAMVGQADGVESVAELGVGGGAESPLQPPASASFRWMRIIGKAWPLFRGNG